MNLPALSQQHQPSLYEGETAASAAAAQAKALIEARYTVAIRRPRDMDVVREKLLKECKRPTFAEHVQYSKPVGKKKMPNGQWEQQYVRGPSIRFVEAAIRSLGNIVVEETTTYDDPDKRIITLCVTDLESNLPVTTSIMVEKTVERKYPKDGDEIISKRLNSNGEEVFTIRATDDQIMLKKNSAISKALRTNGLRLLPGDIVDECLAMALATQQKADAQDPEAARKKIIDAFTAINVPVDQLKQFIGHDMKGVSAAEIQFLRELHAAIRDGETSWRTAWDEKFPQEGKAAVVDQLAGAVTKKEPPKAEQKQQPAPQQPPAQKEWEPSPQEVGDAIKRADATDEAQTAAIRAKHGLTGSNVGPLSFATRRALIAELDQLAGL